MKKTIISICLLLLTLSIAACTSNEAKSDSSGQTSSAIPSQGESMDGGDSSIAPAEPESSGAQQDPGAENIKFTQQTADGTEGAVITFLADGTFEFRPVFYDGSPSVTGTYETTDSAYVLTVLETTAQNIIVEDLGSIAFQFDGDNLVYQGTAVGETSDGAVFAP